MNAILAIAVGGGLGAVARHLLNTVMAHAFGTGFPYGIMLINVLGSVAMGGLIGLFAFRVDVAPIYKLFLTTGVLGGFTTFSTFSLDSVLLIERGAYGLAMLYIGLSLVLSIAGLMVALAGMRLWLA